MNEREHATQKLPFSLPKHSKPKQAKAMFQTICLDGVHLSFPQGMADGWLGHFFGNHQKANDFEW